MFIHTYVPSASDLSESIPAPGAFISKVPPLSGRYVSIPVKLHKSTTLNHWRILSQGFIKSCPRTSHYAWKCPSSCLLSALLSGRVDQPLAFSPTHLRLVSQLRKADCSIASEPMALQAEQTDLRWLCFYTIK